MLGFRLLHRRRVSATTGDCRDKTNFLVLVRLSATVAEELRLAVFIRPKPSAMHDDGHRRLSPTNENQALSADENNVIS